MTFKKAKKIIDKVACPYCHSKKGHICNEMRSFVDGRAPLKSSSDLHWERIQAASEEVK